ncbi:putative metallopeptidase, catalytic domain superfamily, PGBD-like superfamily [Helianthus debilis subsp. tardiflorus]
MSLLYSSQRINYQIIVHNFTDVFDDTFEAVVNDQKKLGLTVTGKLDAVTVTQIMSPFSGMSDYVKQSTNSSNSNNNIHVSKHYAYFSGEPRWGRSAHMTLTYAFSGNHMINYLSSDDVRDTFGGLFRGGRL